MSSAGDTEEEGKLLNSNLDWVDASVLDGMPVGYYFAASWYVQCAQMQHTSLSRSLSTLGGGTGTSGAES